MIVAMNIVVGKLDRVMIKIIKKKGVKKEESSNGFYDLNMYTYSSCTLMLVFKLLD